MFCYGKKKFFPRAHSAVLALAPILLFITNCLFAVEKAHSPERAGYKILPLKHISVEQGKKCLAKVVTGTITHFPGSSTLLVTARPSELAKAKILLDLVDGPDRFIIKAIRPVPANINTPSSQSIAARLSPRLTRGISIGSFSDPPPADASIKAIVDIHDDSVVVIAPVGSVERIVSAVRQLMYPRAPKEPNKAKAQDRPETSAIRNVSGFTMPNEARFLLAANSEMKTEPNATATSLEYKTSELAAAGQSYKLPTLTGGEQIVNLALADRQKLTVTDLLSLIGPYMELDFLYEDKDVQQEITINPHGKFAGPIKVKDLYPLLESLLKLKNLAMTRGKGNLVTIALVGNALDIDPLFLPAGENEIEYGDGIVQRVFKLDHTDTVTAERLLTSMKLATNIIAVPETKTLIVTGYTYRMPRIQALLDIVNRPGEPKNFRFRQLQYTMAGTLATKLQTLTEQLGTVPITITAQETTPTSLSARPKRRGGESSVAYSARVRMWLRARQRQTATTIQRTTARQPESDKHIVYLEADERTNRILMIGLDEQLDDVEDLINTLDVVQQDLRTLELYKIHHVGAEDVKKQLEELGIISSSLTAPYSSRITSGARPPTKRTATAPRTSTLRRTQMIESIEAPTEKPQIIVVEPTNSLLVNTTAEQHVEIAEILSYVDTETDEQEIPYKVYPLENQSPEHLVTVLEPLIQESVLDKEGKVESVRQKQEDQITIVPDPNTFSLIVYASKKNQEWINNLIEQLDKRRPQVLIDVTLVEISEFSAFDYDLQLVSKFPRFEESGGGNMEVLPDLYVAPDDSTSGFTGNHITELGAFVGESLGGQGFYGDTHIQALLTLMQKKGYGRVLAKPKILVNDNELGHIDATNTIYVSRSSSSATTTGEAVVSSSFTFDEFPSGIELDITPHISKGELLRLEINMTRSNQAPPATSGENVPPQPKIENNIETTVTVPDKSTIILGGIIQLDQQKQTWKVPLLGDIPLVGGLFRKIGNSSNDTRLYIFVKGEILRPDGEVVKSDSTQKAGTPTNYQPVFDPPHYAKQDQRWYTLCWSDLVKNVSAIFV